MGSRRQKPTYDELLATIARLEERLSSLEKELAKTKDELAAAKKNSRNSSKPPSSDIVKKKDKSKGKKRRKRKIGGQPGHPKHERVFDLSEADQKHTDTLDECPHGGTVDLIPLPADTKIL